MRMEIGIGIGIGIGRKETRSNKVKNGFIGYVDNPFECMNGVLTIKDVCIFRQSNLPEIFDCDNCNKKLGRKRIIKRNKIAHSA